MKKLGVSFGPLAVLFVCLALFVPYFARADADPSLRTLNYLALHQLENGAIFEEGDLTPRFDLTAWTAMSFSSAGYDPATVKKTATSSSLSDYLASNVCSQTDTVSIERSILALRSFNFDLKALSCDLFDKLDKVYGADGSIGGDIIGSVFALLAYKADARLVPAQTVNYVLTRQSSDGGFEPYSPWGTESTFTAQTVQALIATGVSPSDPQILKAKQYLKNLQAPSGGFKYQAYNTASNSGSTAAVIMAAYAIGESPNDPYWSMSDRDATEDLLSFQKGNGAFRYDFDPLWGDSTPVFSSSYGMAVPALEGKHLPFTAYSLKPFSNYVEALPINSPLPSATPEDAMLESFSPTLIQDNASDTAVPPYTSKSENAVLLQTPTPAPNQTGTATPLVLNSPEVLGANINLPQNGIKIDWLKVLYLVAAFGGAFMVLYLIGRRKNA